jgi:hypothetical protein
MRWIDNNANKNEYRACLASLASNRLTRKQTTSSQSINQNSINKKTKIGQRNNLQDTNRQRSFGTTTTRRHVVAARCVRQQFACLAD